MYSWILSTSCLLAKGSAQPRSSGSQNLRPRRRPRCLARPFTITCTRNHEEENKPRTETSRKVNILPMEVVQRIAAGEVIAGYDSVVQELVENSIDAKAKVVSVDVDLVTNSVTVKDNGTGISPEQGLFDIARCNATSKLRNLTELNDGVHTLGFRGQGLWAITMNAARVEISSRTCDSLCGMSVVFTSDGHPLRNSISPVPMAVGTTVTVTGLRWSPRPVEAKKVVKRCRDWLFRAAMCYPELDFHLTRCGRTTWRSVASESNTEDSRIEILAHELKRHPNDFRSASRSVKGVGEITILVGLPSTVHSSSKSWMMTAINGRCVVIRSIRRAISHALDVKKGRYPVAFVKIDTDPGLVNWNVLPMKTTMRFHSAEVEEKLVALVPALVRDALQGSLNGELREAGTGDVPSLLSDGNLRGGMNGVISLLLSKRRVSNGSDVTYRGNRTESDGEREALALSILQARVVAQLLNTYILVEHKGGIMLVEQHVADERVIYEGLVQNWKCNRLVALERPLKLPENMQPEWIFTLSTLGLVSSDDADDVKDSYEIAVIPEVMSVLSESKLLSLVLQICREGSTIEEASASVACRLAVRNGTSLNMREMEGILRKLVRCDNGFTCPHGRPIFIELQTKELARLFGRSWTPESMQSGGNAGSGVLRRRGILAE